VEPTPPPAPLLINWKCRLCGYTQREMFRECPHCCTEAPPLQTNAELRGSASGDFTVDNLEIFPGSELGGTWTVGNLTMHTSQPLNSGNIVISGNLDSEITLDA